MPELPRGRVFVFDKISVEVPVILIPDQVGDLRDAAAPFRQQHERVFEANLLDERSERPPGLFSEQPRQVIGGNIEKRADRRQVLEIEL